MLPRPSRSAPAVLALLATLLIAAPVAAQSGPSAQREGAEEILEHAQRLEDGRGIRSGRELSVVLAQLAANRNDLSRSDRKEADRLLARPTDANDGGVGGPYSTSARVLKTCSTSFCVHWVDTTADAPPLANANGCSAPDYVDHVLTALEQSRDVENVQLGWRSPVSDSTRGGDTRTDVYLKELNASGGGLYGYAATDGGSGLARPAFMVFDDDYELSEFPQYGGDPTVPAEVTAAHEYNHVLQYAYDVGQDAWMYESTATWMEEKVFPTDNDYHDYMGTWADHPEQPLTSASGLKMYGSAIWNHWLEQNYDAATVRGAWEESENTVGFAPDAYQLAIQDAGGTSFAADFGDFAASTAEWDGVDSGIHEGKAFPRDVRRESAPLTIGTLNRTATIDHTAFKLFNIPVPAAGTGPLRLTASLRQGASGTIGTIALVGRVDAPDGDSDVTKVVARTNVNGDAVVVTLDDPGSFDRLTAVVANADVRNTGFSQATEDWIWSRDAQSATLSLAAVPAASPDNPVEENGTPTATVTPNIAVCGTTTLERAAAVTVTPTATPTSSATPSPTVSPTVTPAPTVTPPIATSLRLTRNSSRIGSVLRKGVLSLFGQANKAGSHSARATVDATTAKRLKVGRRTTTAGTGRRTATAPAKLKINVKLTRKLRAALNRNRKRSVKVKVAVTFRPADGTAAVLDTLTVKLKP
jgi:hypothetical protein